MQIKVPESLTKVLNWVSIYKTSMFVLFAFMTHIQASGQRKYDLESGNVTYHISARGTNERIILLMQFQDYGRQVLLEWAVPAQKRYKYLKVDTLQYRFDGDSLMAVEKRVEHFRFESLNFQNLLYERDTIQKIFLNKKQEIKIKRFGITATNYYHFFWREHRGNVVLYNGLPLNIRIDDFEINAILFDTNAPEIDKLLRKIK